MTDGQKKQHIIYSIIESEDMEEKLNELRQQPDFRSEVLVHYLKSRITEPENEKMEEIRKMHFILGILIEPNHSVERFINNTDLSGMYIEALYSASEIDSPLDGEKAKVKIKYLLNNFLIERDLIIQWLFFDLKLQKDYLTYKYMSRFEEKNRYIEKRKRNIEGIKIILNWLHEHLEGERENKYSLKEEKKDKDSNEKKEINKLSYLWQDNPLTELPELYNKMKGVFIASEHTLEQFTAIFTGQPVENITPIKWKGKIALLAYFIDQIFEKEKIPPNSELWSIAKECFENAENLKQAKNNYLANKNGKPKGYSKIDNLLSFFK